MASFPGRHWRFQLPGLQQAIEEKFSVFVCVRFLLILLFLCLSQWLGKLPDPMASRGVGHCRANPPDSYQCQQFPCRGQLMVEKSCHFFDPQETLKLWGDSWLLPHPVPPSVGCSLPPVGVREGVVFHHGSTREGGAEGTSASSQWLGWGLLQLGAWYSHPPNSPYPRRWDWHMKELGWCAFCVNVIFIDAIRSLGISPLILMLRQCQVNAEIPLPRCWINTGIINESF